MHRKHTMLGGNMTHNQICKYLVTTLLKVGILGHPLFDFHLCHCLIPYPHFVGISREKEAHSY